MDEQLIRSLEKINTLARALHGSDGAVDAHTFKSLAAHVDEVKALLAAEDLHWKAETLDIIIHAMTLLRGHGVGTDEFEGLMQRRLARFQEKISAAIAAGDRR